MNILFYEPYNHSVNYIVSIAERFIQDGNKVFFISHDEWGPIHEALHDMGASILKFESEVQSRPLYYIRRIKELVKLCDQHKMEVVYSHYQEANIIAVIAQYFTKIPWIPTRHHSDCAFVDSNRKEMIADKIINRLAQICISPSRKVTDQMISIEGMNPRKVREINYGYNFNALRRPEGNQITHIRETYTSDLLLVKAARFIPEKRHVELLECIKSLLVTGANLQLLLLGDGPEKSRIEEVIAELELEDHVHLCGFKSNVQDYYAAADIIVHFSISEASNSAIKEAAMCGTTAIVCDNVGDFGDYFVDRENGFLLDRENPSFAFPEVVREILDNKHNLNELGTRLKAAVIERFDISHVIQNYYELHKELMK